MHASVCIRLEKYFSHSKQNIIPGQEVHADNGRSDTGPGRIWRKC